jgi:hypothetical protein
MHALSSRSSLSAQQLARVALSAAVLAPLACLPEPPVDIELPCSSGECCDDSTCSTGKSCDEGGGVCTANFVNGLCFCQSLGGAGGGGGSNGTVETSGAMSSSTGSLQLAPGATRVFTYTPPTSVAWPLPSSLGACPGATSPLVLRARGSMQVRATRSSDPSNLVATFVAVGGQLSADSFTVPCLGAAGPSRLTFSRFQGTIHLGTGAVTLSVVGRIANDLFPLGAELGFQAEKVGHMDLATGGLDLVVRTAEFTELY